MNSADHRGVAALNELETNEQTGHSCAPEVAGALNVGLEGQRKDTAAASHLSVAPQPVQTAEDERAAFEAELQAMPEWAPEFEPHRAWVERFAWDLWQARAALASKPVPAGDVESLVKDIHDAIAELAGVARYPDLTDAIDRLAALAAQPVREPMSVERQALNDAAPELLKYLQWAVDNPDDDAYWIEQARAAIAKATRE